MNESIKNKTKSNTTYKVTMVGPSGDVVGYCAKFAPSPEEAMRLAEHDYRDFAAYTAEVLQDFDYSCAGGMMAAYKTKVSRPMLRVGDTFAMGRIQCEITIVSSFSGCFHYGFTYLTDEGKTKAGWMPVPFVLEFTGHSA